MLIYSFSSNFVFKNQVNINKQGQHLFQAKEFCDFWGEKSEMRRFKDGTIHEAVLWTSSPCQSDRRLVCKKIVQYVLERCSLGLEPVDILITEQM